jgi:hypothetical protein
MDHKMEEATTRNRFNVLKKQLQKFQSERLKATYEDIMTHPEYEKIGVFFFDKLYAPEDFSFRDASIKKLHTFLKGKVYKGMVSAVTKVIELHELSDMLDNRMTEKIMEKETPKDNTPPEITMDLYKSTYKSLDNYDQRVYQIKLSTEVTRAFYQLSRKWIVGVSLKTVHGASQILGMGKIMDFIFQGYQAFRSIKHFDYFVETIEKRELEWHDGIWFT